MFQSRARKATAAARPVKISGVARVSVSVSAKSEPAAPARHQREGAPERRAGTPRAASRRAPARRERQRRRRRREPGAARSRGSSRITPASSAPCPAISSAERVAASSVVGGRRRRQAAAVHHGDAVGRARGSRRGPRRSAATPAPRAPRVEQAAVHVGDGADVEAPRRLVGEDERGSRARGRAPRISFCMLPPESRRIGRVGAGAAHVVVADDRRLGQARADAPAQEAAALNGGVARASRGRAFSAIGSSPIDAIAMAVFRECGRRRRATMARGDRPQPAARRRRERARRRRRGAGDERRQAPPGRCRRRRRCRRSRLRAPRARRRRGRRGRRSPRADDVAQRSTPAPGAAARGGFGAMLAADHQRRRARARSVAAVGRSRDLAAGAQHQRRGRQTRSTSSSLCR